MAVVEVDRLTYSYPGSTAPALKDISLRVEAGQMVGVIGANGAGKSTLCLVLAGLIPALFFGEILGNVRVTGLDTQKHTPGQLAGKVGLVLQNPLNQLSTMRYTVFEEVAFGLENLGVAREEMPARIERALSQVELTGLEGRSPYSLSGGQQQRLALASILVFEPPLLILDEPTAMLDPKGSQGIFTIIRNLALAGTTIILTGHSLEQMARNCDWMLALEEGEIILEGTPAELLTSSRLAGSGAGTLRLTEAARLAQSRGYWPQDRALPITFEEARNGFAQMQQQANGNDESHAD